MQGQFIDSPLLSENKAQKNLTNTDTQNSIPDTTSVFPKPNYNIAYRQYRVPENVHQNIYTDFQKESGELLQNVRRKIIYVVEVKDMAG